MVYNLVFVLNVSGLVPSWATSHFFALSSISALLSLARSTLDTLRLKSEAPCRLKASIRLLVSELVSVAAQMKAPADTSSAKTVGRRIEGLSLACIGGAW